tara:strand:- start:306 stop:599 length:294 start_codon:yes stop_codon:yes gene_type:complete
VITKERRAKAAHLLKLEAARLGQGGTDDRRLAEAVGVLFEVVDNLEEQLKMWQEVGRNANVRAEGAREDLADSQIKIASLRRRVYDLEVKLGVRNVS